MFDLLLGDIWYGKLWLCFLDHVFIVCVWKSIGVAGEALQKVTHSSSPSSSVDGEAGEFFATWDATHQNGHGQKVATCWSLRVWRVFLQNAYTLSRKYLLALCCIYYCKAFVRSNPFLSYSLIYLAVLFFTI